MARIHNFSAGPCTLPLSVLEEASAELVDFQGNGMSIVEMSHRSAPYEAVQDRCLALAAELFAVPDDFETLILQGGATLQFAMVPMNLMVEGRPAGYVDSGAWASKALADAGHYGDAYAAWSGEADGYRAMPQPADLTLRDDTSYLHVTSNETIGGIRMTSWPDAGVPLVGDMSSDYLSRKIPWDLFDLVYGGAQKNLGPAGATLVFIRRSALENANADIGAYLRYSSHASKASMYNTPPVFAVYMMAKVLEWMKAEGGVDEMERRAAARAGLVYGAIEASGGFFSSPVESADRSHMNIVFRLQSPDLEAA
ncbi:MAG: 3-phosphoserine/phosphohydroxythreonine transaminase, partial [Acidimicrobiia bacterium]|nr:3-phosphoserine/phosphohydroxythreonine transaminase [Acidimicrobiia bacterium]